MVQNRQKVKVNPFTFWNLAIFNIFESLSKIYVQWSSNDKKTLFKA